MRYASISFLVLVLWVIPFRYYYVCKVKDHCQEATQTKTPQPQTISVKRPYELKLVDGDSVVLNNFQHFYFPDNQVRADLSANNEAFLDLVTAYLLSHPNKKVLISAPVRGNCIDESQLAKGLAKQRVLFVRNQILQRGVKKNQINDEVFLTYDSDSTMVMPILFEIARL